MADTEDQPSPGAPLTPRQNYQRAMQRLRSLHEKRVIATGNVDVVKLEANAAMRAVELNAISNLLIAKGIVTLDELYGEIAVSAVNAGNALSLFAEMNAPKLLDANGQKVNGS